MPHPRSLESRSLLHPTRRDVLRGMAGLGLLSFTGGAGSLLSGCSPARTSAEVMANDPETMALVDGLIGIDMHSHAAGANRNGPPLYDLAERIRTGRMTAICLCHSADAPVVRRDPDDQIRTSRQARTGELWRHTENRLKWFDEFVKAQGLRRALKKGDLTAAHQDKTPMIVQAIEGCQFLEGKLEHVNDVFQRGVRHLQMVHFYRSEMGDNQTERADQGGLTGFGREAIAEMNRLGIVIDVAHATMEFVEAAAKISKTPLILSHTAVAKRELRDFTRLISKEHAQLIANTGGVVGVWGNPGSFKSLEQYVEGIAHAVDAAGVDYVGFGTDNMGFGMRPSVWDDYRDFPLIVRLLRKRGFSPEEIRKIAGGNYLRVYERSMKAA